MQEIIKKFKIPLYGGNLNLIITSSIRESIESRKMDDSSIDDSTEAYVSEKFDQNGGHTIFVLFNSQSISFKKRFLTIDSIAHETKHAADFIYHHRGVSDGISNGSLNEHTAYLYGWILSSIFKVVEPIIYEDRLK